jgi:polyhydroxyalkanoate synthesis regulator phasin
MPAKRRKLVEAVLTDEMEKEIKETKRVEKLKAKGRLPEDQNTKLQASFSFGLTKGSVEAILKRYVGRGEISKELSVKLLYSLCTSIVELTTEQDMKGDWSIENVRWKTEVIRELLFEKIIDIVAKDIWVKIRMV